MYINMENWAEIRRRVLAEGQSKRSVCREFDIHWDKLQKILVHAGPAGYRRREPRPSKRRTHTSRSCPGKLDAGRTEPMVGSALLVLSRLARLGSGESS